MAQKRDWQDELKMVLEMMGELSRQDDPQVAAVMYAKRLRESGMFPADERLSISRRNLSAPFYRITRSSVWKENIDPWQSNDKLPMFSSGLLSELIYSNQPAIIDHLPDRLDDHDPAIDYLRGFQLLIALPQFEHG